VLDHERESAAAGLDKSRRVSSLSQETSHDLVHEGKARHSFSGHPCTAVASPEQPDTCCSMVRAGGTTYNIPNSIIEHSHHLTPTLRVAIPLASNEKPTSHPFKRKTNKRDRKKDKVCEICVSINTSSSERTADMAKQQTARTEIDFQPGRRVGGTSYRLSRRSRREGLLVQPSTCFAGCESELGRNLCSLFLPSCLDLPGC
jgi:hypothetical protein